MAWETHYITAGQVYEYVQRVMAMHPERAAEVAERFPDIEEPTAENMTEVLWDLIEKGLFTVKATSSGQILDIIEVPKPAEDADHRTWPMRDLL